MNHESQFTESQWKHAVSRRPIRNACRTGFRILSVFIRETAYFTVIQWRLYMLHITTEYAVFCIKMPHIRDCAISVRSRLEVTLIMFIMSQLKFFGLVSNIDIFFREIQRLLREKHWHNEMIESMSKRERSQLMSDLLKDHKGKEKVLRDHGLYRGHPVFFTDPMYNWTWLKLRTVFVFAYSVHICNYWLLVRS